MKKSFVISIIFSLISQVLFSQDYSIDQKQIKVLSKEKNYEIKITYPQLNVQLKTSYFGFNNLVRKRMEAERDSFIVWMKDWEINEYNKDFSSSYEIGDSVFYADNNLISLHFYGYSYFAGAAHPNNWSFTINYDLENSKEIFLKDLLEYGWENKISEICIAEISMQKKEYGIEPDEWLKEGAGPKEDNFKVFNVIKKGLLVTFPTYQVGAYVEGPSEVYINYTEIKDIITVKSILNKFIK
jgi:hypothetical protein